MPTRRPALKKGAAYHDGAWALITAQGMVEKKTRVTGLLLVGCHPFGPVG